MGLRVFAGRPTLVALLGLSVLTSGQSLAATRSLTISGTPATSVQPGQSYTFVPTVQNAKRRVRFSVVNRPAWAFFSDRRGGLSGVPQTNNVGVYQNIVITVTDGVSTAKLPAFSITVAAPAPTPAPTPTPAPAPTPTPTPTTGSAIVMWTPPLENVDGSTLTDLAGYRIVYGIAAGALTQTAQVPTAGLASFTIDNLSVGTWYFAVKSYNAAGTESALSNLATKTIQ